MITIVLGWDAVGARRFRSTVSSPLARDAPQRCTNDLDVVVEAEPPLETLADDALAEMVLDRRHVLACDEQLVRSGGDGEIVEVEARNSQRDAVGILGCLLDVVGRFAPAGPGAENALGAATRSAGR